MRILELVLGVLLMGVWIIAVARSTWEFLPPSFLWWQAVGIGAVAGVTAYLPVYALVLWRMHARLARCPMNLASCVMHRNLRAAGFDPYPRVGKVHPGKPWPHQPLPSPAADELATGIRAVGRALRGGGPCTCDHHPSEPHHHYRGCFCYMPPPDVIRRTEEAALARGKYVNWGVGGDYCELPIDPGSVMEERIRKGQPNAGTA